MWFDRCCINQSDVDVGLRCLPVHLAACSSLLVLRGDTYLKRLWCSVELFVFSTINPMGDVEVLDLPRVGVPRHHEGQQHTSRRRAPSFDVRDAECSNPRDHEQLLSVIELSAGRNGVRSFNEWIEERIKGSKSSRRSFLGKRRPSASSSWQRKASSTPLPGGSGIQSLRRVYPLGALDDDADVVSAAEAGVSATVPPEATVGAPAIAVVS